MNATLLTRRFPLLVLTIATSCMVIITDPIEASAQVDITGYIQTEWLHYDLRTDENDRAIFNEERKNLFQIRRGRLKGTHKTDDGIKGVFQLDFTERGVGIKDAYVTIPVIDTGVLDFQAGLFNRPNFEVAYSSSRRESPERSQVVRALYPGERGLGFMFTLNPLTSSSLNPELQVGLFNGRATKPENDAFKDITARLTFDIPTGEDSRVDLSLGGLYYISGLKQIDDTLLISENGSDAFEVSEASGSNAGYGNRSHMGVEMQLNLDLLPFGETTIRGEYLLGQAPFAANRVRQDIVVVEQNDSIQLLDTVDVSVPTLRLRNVGGYYVYFVQELGDHLNLVAKYDVFDRNTDLAGTEVTTSADRSSSILGLGLFADFGPVRLTGYYEMPSYADQEARYRDENGVLHTGDLKDNKTTIRFQYLMK